MLAETDSPVLEKKKEDKEKKERLSLVDVEDGHGWFTAIGGPTLPEVFCSIRNTSFAMEL